MQAYRGAERPDVPTQDWRVVLLVFLRTNPVAFHEDIAKRPIGQCSCNARHNRM